MTRHDLAAYKAMCLTHHPDRHTSSPAPLRKAAEEKFKLLQEALSILGGCAKASEAGAGRDKTAVCKHQACCIAAH